MKGNRIKTSLMIITALIVMIALGTASVLQGKTIVEWWLPAVICAIIAVFISALLYRFIRYITGFKNFAVNCLSAFAVAFSIILGTFYTLNYYCSDTLSRHNISTTVVRKYSKERYKVKRVSRNRTTRGEKYHVYYIDIELPDGSSKSLDITLSDFMRLRKGQSLTLEIEKGLFGIMVFKNMKFPIRKYTSDKRFIR